MCVCDNIYDNTIYDIIIYVLCIYVYTTKGLLGSSLNRLGEWVWQAVLTLLWGGVKVLGEQGQGLQRTRDQDQHSHCQQIPLKPHSCHILVVLIFMSSPAQPSSSTMTGD